MERNRNNTVAINMDTRDDSPSSTLNPTENNKNAERNIDKKRSPTGASVAKMKEHHSSLKIDLEVIHHPSFSPKEDVTELTHLKNTTKVDTETHRERSQERIPAGKLQARKNVQRATFSRDQDSSIRKSAEDLSQRDDVSERVSNLVSPSTATVYPSRSRPGSVSKTSPARERPLSSFSVHGGTARPRSSRNLGRQNMKSQYTSSGDEDDEDFNEGLSELLGTVRQYAQEIREIYAPIKKEEEERILKNNERNARRKSKELNKGLTVKPGKQVRSPVHHEVRVEIHKTEDQVHDKMLEEGRRASRHETLSLSKSNEASPSNHLASLHVEEEKLSRTWPRGHARPTSRERFWSDATLNKQKSNISSSPSSFTRSQTPADWCEPSTIQHEKEILNKAFQRIQNPSGDPLISATSNVRPMPQIHEQMLNSRQSVIEVARQHKQARHTALPSISIISPPTQYRRGSWNSSGGILPSAPPMSPDSAVKPSAPPLEDNESHNVINPKTHLVSGDKGFRESSPRQSSSNRKTAEKSNVRGEQKGRQPMEQELGQHSNFEKY